MDTTENEKLYQLNTVVLTEAPPVGEKLPVYLFTETPDNQESVLKRGAEFFHAGKALNILLIDNLGGSNPGYPGAPPWQKRLRELKVLDEKVILIPFHEPVLHTLSEATVMVQFVRNKGWGAVTIVSPPFHGTRCFLSMVTAVNHLNPKGLCVYNQVGITQPWDEQVVHSQGTTTGTRRDLIIGEIRRIVKYQKEGTPVLLCSADAALEYLEWRDNK